MNKLMEVLNAVIADAGNTSILSHGKSWKLDSPELPLKAGVAEVKRLLDGIVPPSTRKRKE